METTSDTNLGFVGISPAKPCGYGREFRDQECEFPEDAFLRSLERAEVLRQLSGNDISQTFVFSRDMVIDTSELYDPSRDPELGPEPQTTLTSGKEVWRPWS